MHGNFVVVTTFLALKILFGITAAYLKEIDQYFCQSWIKRNVIYVKELADNNGDILKYKIFIQYSIPDQI